VSVDIPAGFESVSFFSRLCRSGMVSWLDITSGRVSVRRCFEVALMIDWQEMSERKANIIMAARNG
jgi:hypothetical protein